MGKNIPISRNCSVKRKMWTRSCIALSQYFLGTFRVFFLSALEVVRSRDITQLSQIWKNPNPLVSALLVCFVAILLCWVAQVVTGNCSQVDRLWSILPVVYVTLYAWGDLRAAALLSMKDKRAGRPDGRVLLQWLLVVLWSVRLTFNFWRKGGYSPTFEDYRWEHVRKLWPRPVFELFSLVFVSAAQNLLCLAMTFPGAVAWHVRGKVPVGPLDWAAAAMFVFYLLVEAHADQEQWEFQSEKGRQILAREKRTGDYARGFLTRGLFRYSRHPAWFCENVIWWSFSLFGIAASGCSPLNPLLLPSVCLALLFQGSIWITEMISVARYPTAYPQYQRITSAFVPWFPKGNLPDVKRD